MSVRVSDIGEFGLIERINDLLRQEGLCSPQVTLGIGDDTAAFLPRPDYELLVTCDCLVEGRHFLFNHISPFDLGRRAMAQNISDIGAMGGRPLYALVSLGLKKETPVSEIEALYRGFLKELNPFNGAVIGGNLTESGSGLFIDITLIGEVARGKGIRRSGARAGDAILVTGYPGESAAGLQLLLRNPEGPRISEHPLVKRYNNPGHRAGLGEVLAQTGRVTAMIDTSDGFLGDLAHICVESGVGAEIIKEKLPVSEALRQAAFLLHQDPYDFVLGDSDDYELIITCRPQEVCALQALADRFSPLSLTAVGVINGSSRETALILPDGTRLPAKPSGWDHFRLKRTESREG